MLLEKYPQVTVEYDADTEVMTVKLSSGAVYADCPEDSGRGLLLKHASKKTDGYVRQNAFGAKAYFNVFRVDTTCVDMVDKIFTFRVDRKLAKAEKNSLKLMIVGNLKPPYVKNGTKSGGGDMREPIVEHFVMRQLALDINAIWLVSGLTGSILSK